MAAMPGRRMITIPAKPSMIAIIRWRLSRFPRVTVARIAIQIGAVNSLPQDIPLVEHHSGLRSPAALARKDRPIFQAAVACGATHLLTGDLKDFGPFMNRPGGTLGITVQTVSDFLRHVQE